MNMPESASFGTWLRQHRRALDLTQKALANQVGCAEITVRRMEADEYKPSSELALVLLEKLGIPELERPQWVRFARGLTEYPKSQPALSPAHEQSTNLPIPLTSFIGRKKDIALIQQRLAQHRLVTLIGAGGIGKTRLSQQVASQLLEKFVNGVWLVELASLSDPALVPQTVAAVFGIQQGTTIRATLETLIHFLRAKTILLILDNCEHLLDACAGLADQLLKNCPNLKILTTSREALGIIGEALYQVPSLTTPEIQPIESIEKLESYESIRLFDERAQLVQMDFSLTKENAASVAQICSRLDGIPLAIELAAVRVQMFSTEQIASQLNEWFHTLAGGSRTALPRHQTLQASIDWSWNLLYDSEQAVLRRLSVFASGFTLQAAGQVCVGNGVEFRQVAGVISQLLMKSLIVMNQDSGHERRYRLLETIRQYAHERLVEAGEENHVRTLHWKYFLGFSEQAELALKGPTQTEWFTRLKDELNNIRVALEWADKTDVESGLHLASRLHRFWESFDIPEGMRWLAKFIEHPQSKTYPLARAKALLAQGWLSQWLQQFDLGRSAAQECLELYRACGDQRGEVDALSLLAFTSDNAQAIVLFNQALSRSEVLRDRWRQAHILGMMGLVDNNKQRRKSSCKEAIDLFREVGDLQWLGVHLANMADFEMSNGDLEAAQKWLNEAAKMSQHLNNKYLIERIFGAYGGLEIIKGNYQKARAHFQASMTIVEDLGFRMDLIWYQARMGYLDLYEGNIAEAQKLFADTAQNFQKDGNKIGVVFALEGMAGVYIAVDKPEVAARLIGWADTTREKVHDQRPLIEQADVDKIIAACVAKLGKAEFTEAYKMGKKMTLDEAVAYTLEEN